MCNPIYHLSTFPMQCTVHWRRRWHPTPVLLLENPMDREPGGLQPMGSRSVGHNRATSLSFSLSCIGEGNGNPLQCSCLENPRDGGPWWAAVYGVAQRWTQLKRLSSSSSGGETNFPHPSFSFVYVKRKGRESFCLVCPYNKHVYSHLHVHIEKGMTEDEMAGRHLWLNGRESEWTPGVGDGQGALACCNSWGRKESDMTEWLSWTESVESGVAQRNAFWIRLTQREGWGLIAEGNPGVRETLLNTPGAVEGKVISYLETLTSVTPNIANVYLVKLCMPLGDYQ